MAEPVLPHPNAPRRPLLALAFAGILVSAAFGGLIGWGLVDTSCSEAPTVVQQLLDGVPGYEAPEQSCDLKLLGGAVAGTLVAGIGAGVVAGLMLRAQAEWRAHPPSDDDRRSAQPIDPRRAAAPPDPPPGG